MRSSPLTGCVLIQGGRVLLDRSPQAAPVFTPATTRRIACRVCPSATPDYSILLLRVTVPAGPRPKPVYVSIGLAGNGMIARRILYSLRAA